MTLSEYIKLLEKYPSEQIVSKGLGNPHSWRGIYAELAFEPVENTTIGEMLEAAKSALNKTMTGYKGGDFLMDGNTTIHIDYYGEWTDGSETMKMLFDLMLGKHPTEGD